MIKLNNKNITYVALADSNNSVKGVKEIWYADSNNSVKLVYRRKDALIEGEDYEKYHWLRTKISANEARSFMTLPLNSSVFEFKRKFDVFGNLPYFSSSGHTYVTGTAKKVSIYDKVNGGIIETSNFTLNTGDVVDVVCDGQELYFNNQQFTMYENPWRIIYFRLNGAGSSDFSTSKISIDNSDRYIPCKLLKPVPKWLDANGIRRQVGECGMIDLISGKFYGNVNSVGTFTVENYYERKEWLVGDGSAYMQISQTSRTDFNINLTYKLSNVYKQMLYGSFYSTSGGWKGNMLTWGETNGIADKILLRISTSNGNNYINLGAQDVDVVHTIKVVDGRCYFDDVDKGVCPGYSIYNYDKPFLLFNGYNVNTITESNASNASISKFSIEGYCNLIPCTLTMDLPASMDANNIARTKGTSGMWDLVSDKFYGNVANSGTFKAVNLAEGVDYEVHQWLAVEMPRGNFMNLPLNSSNFSYSRIYTSIGNTAHLSSNQDEYAYFSANLIGIGVWDGSKTTNYKSVDISDLSIVCDSNQLLFNSVEFPMYGFPPRVTFNNSSTATNTVLKQSSITVDGIERYIPVKLLKSIPAKYDANGIARQAGECGMYDTVNDVFYGNVASSGSFTVEDDN